MDEKKWVFPPGERVIAGDSIPAVVISVHVYASGPWYKVGYWYDGDYRIRKLPEWEIRAETSNDNRTLGFST